MIFEIELIHSNHPELITFDIETNINQNLIHLIESSFGELYPDLNTQYTIKSIEHQPPCLACRSHQMGQGAHTEPGGCLYQGDD